MVQSLSICLALLALGGAAYAQPAPGKFEFAAPPAKPADWKVAAKGGFLATTGNSQSRSASVSLTGSRETLQSKVSVEAGAAYGQSNILVPIVDANGYVAGLARQSQVTTNQWRARGRYDRFLTFNNAAYAAAGLAADRIAGKSLMGGGQVGYSRHLLHSDAHNATAELGYDVAFESYVDPGVAAVAIHSARVFLGEQAKLTADTAVNVSAEALFNLNTEHAPDATDPTGARDRVKPFHDSRVIGKAGINTNIWKKLAFGFGVTVAYDQNPAPRPVPKGGNGKYAPGFFPFADRVDTLTEATLVFTFL
jgi:hypothetical protein